MGNLYGFPILFFAKMVAIDCMDNFPTLAMPQQHPDNDKNNDGTETATAQFFSAIAGEQSPEQVVHNYWFYR